MILALLWGCAAAVESPLLHMTRTPDAPDVSGTVAEAVPAGGYRYLRVDDQWFATLDHGQSAGDHVRLDPVGRADNFYSRRTGRSFSALWFAAVVDEGQPVIP